MDMVQETTDKPNEKLVKNIVPDDYSDGCSLEDKDNAVRDLLCLPKIQELLKDNEEYKDRIVRAAEEIANPEHSQDKNQIALLEAARAITEGKIKVFFSYKMMDGVDSEADAATKIVSRLKKLGANTLDVTYAPDFQAGDNISDQIKEAIDKAHWFMILIPEKYQNRDWLFYEAGRFWKKITSERVNRVFCFHSKNTEIPSPIDQYKSVESNPKSMKEFIESVFFDENALPGFGAINPHIDNPDDEVRDFINYLERRPKNIVKYYFTPYVKLKIENADELEDSSDLDKCEILQINGIARNLFGWKRTPGTWGDLTEYTSCQSPCTWKNELLDRIKIAYKGRNIESIHATFEGAEKGKFYHPILISTDSSEDKPPEIFNISFDLQIGSQIKQLHIPKSKKVLLTALRLAHRFRWEIIEPYKNKLYEEDLIRIQNVLEQIETEAAQTDLMNENLLVDLFIDNEADKISMMYEDWDKLRNPIEKNGKLDKAFEDKDIKTVQIILQDVDNMNKNFITMVHERLFNEISEE